MNNFSQLFNESRKNYDSGNLLSSEVNDNIKKVQKLIPDQIKKIIYLTQKYNLLDAKSLDEIRLSNKSMLKKLSKQYNIPEEELFDLQSQTLSYQLKYDQIRKILEGGSVND